MQVILLEKFGKLGDIGDKVKVKAGYGRNYLIPQRDQIIAVSYTHLTLPTILRV